METNSNQSEAPESSALPIADSSGTVKKHNPHLYQKGETKATFLARKAAEAAQKKILNVSKLREVIKYNPLPWQREFLRLFSLPDCRFLIILGGKRCGKSTAASDLANIYLHIPASLTWLIAPSYELGRRIWDNNATWANLYFPYLRATEIANTPVIANKETGSKFFIKTAAQESKKNLKGQGGIQLGIFDEGADTDNDVWYQYMQPNLSQRYQTASGEWKYPKVVILTNAVARNWVYDLQMMAKKGVAGYYQMEVPTAIEDASGEIIGSNNPDFLPIEELKRIKAETPQHIWLQDWSAKWPDSEGFVFRGLEEIKRGVAESYIPSHSYVIGYDPAKHADFSVMVVMDAFTRRVVSFSRSQKIDYEHQKQRLIALVKTYGGAKVIIDSTGVGEPLFDSLHAEGINITDFVFTKRHKDDLIRKLSLDIEQKNISIPKEFIDIHDELSFFGKLDRNGRLKYEAPDGKHDDCVMAVALANWELQGKPMEQAAIRKNAFNVEEKRRTTRRFNYR